MPFPSFTLDEVGDISFTLRNMDGEAFTITSATISIYSGTTYTREEVSAQIDGARVYYRETFSVANGYSSGSSYNVLIIINATVGSTVYTERYMDTIEVTADAAVTYLSNLIKKMRGYIDDIGESVSRGVIGLADGSRTVFRLHHNYVDQNWMNITVNGSATTGYSLENNILTFTSAPSLNAAIVADYVYYDYPDSVLETCIKNAVAYLNDAANIGWGSFNGTSWSINSSDEEEGLVLTAAVLEFVSMQMVRLPIAISFGDIGARISIRGAGSERQRAIVEMRAMLYDKIREYRDSDIEFNIIT